MKDLIDSVKYNDIFALKSILLDGRKVSPSIFLNCLTEALLLKRMYIFKVLGVAFVTRMVDNEDADPLTNRDKADYNFNKTKINNWLLSTYRNIMRRMRFDSFITEEELNEEIRKIFKKLLDEDFSLLFNESNLIYKDHVRYVHWLLNEAIKTDDRICLLIVTKSKRLTFVTDSYHLLIKSNYPNREELINNMIYFRNIYDHGYYEVLKEISSDSIKVSSKDVKNIFLCVKIPKKLKMELCETAIIKSNLEFIKYAIESNLFTFTKACAFYIIFRQYDILSYFLDSFPKEFIEFFDEARGFTDRINLFPYSSSLKILFQHKRFKTSRKCRDFFFNLLFQQNLSLLSIKKADDNGNEVLNLLNLILYHSEIIGISQSLIDMAVNYIISGNTQSQNHFIRNFSNSRNISDYFNSNFMFRGKLLSILISYGYTYSTINLTNGFIKTFQHNQLQQYLFNMLLQISSQNQYFELFKLIYGKNKIQPLKSIARFQIRKLIPKPFRFKLKLFVDHYNLSKSNIISILDLGNELFWLDQSDYLHNYVNE